MTKNQRQEMVEVVTDALNEVVIPALENMEERLRKDLASKEDISRLERKFDAQQDRLDRHGIQLEKHEEQIKKLQTAIA